MLLVLLDLERGRLEGRLAMLLLMLRPGAWLLIVRRINVYIDVYGLGVLSLLGRGLLVRGLLLPWLLTFLIILSWLLVIALLRLLLLGLE